MSTKKTQVGTLAGVDLAAALTSVLPMAGTDDTLPILTCVHFETRDGELVLATTNRYLLGTYRLDWDGPEVEALVAGREAKEMLAFAKKAGKAPVTLTFDGREVTVADFERKVSLPLHDGDFPRWRALLPEQTPDRLRFGINPVYMAAFAKVIPYVGDKPGALPVTMSVGMPNKPMRVEIGERFVGLIMPVRLPDAPPVEKPKTGDPIAPPVEVVPEPEAEVTVAEEAEDVVEPEEETAEPEVEPEVEAVAEAEACEACKGYGVVRGGGAKAGDPYKTANGAAQATNPVPCPSCSVAEAVA